MNDTKKRAMALGASLVLVVGVLAVAQRMNGGEASQDNVRWYGEQWDIARRCLAGTPIGRGTTPAALAPSLTALLLEALTEREAGADPAAADPDTLWPARCLPRIESLRAPPELPQDPGPALAALELAARTTLRDAEDAATLDAAVAPLAEAIARTDAAMPSGAEYDRARHPTPRLDGAARLVVASLACPPTPTAPRAFLRASEGGETLHDERTEGTTLERLIGDGDRLRLERSSPTGTETTALHPSAGWREPRFFGDGIVWVTKDDPLTIGLAAADGGGLTVERELAIADLVTWTPIDTVILARTAHGAWLVPWDKPRDRTEVIPPPPDRGLIGTHADGVTVVGWIEEGSLRGVVCRPECSVLPTLVTGEDIQLGVVRGRVVAMTRSTHGPLSFTRVLDRGASTWTAPLPVPRGTLETRSPSGLRIVSCTGTVISGSGVSWIDDAAPAGSR